MERLGLQAVARKPGKGTAKSLRREGRVPGVLYGKTQDPVHVAVSHRELEKATTTHAGFNVMLDLNVDGAGDFVARIREYKADPLTRKFTHVDFQVIDLTQKLRVEIPVTLTGEPEGVKEGGVLMQNRRTLDIECLPTNIPDEIVVDVSALNIGDSIHIRDVALPEGAEVQDDLDLTVVTVTAPTKVEEPETPAEGEAAAEGTEGAEGAAAADGAEGGEKKEAAPAGEGEKKE
jgi:large subunit ribosomal protein L25